MFKTVQLPASVTDLATGLANVDGDAFTLRRKKNVFMLFNLCVCKNKQQGLGFNSQVIAKDYEANIKYTKVL